MGGKFGQKTSPTNVEIVGPISAFDEVLVATLDPLIQLQYPYNANARLVSSLVAGSGTITVENSLVTLSTGTTTASDVLFRSVRDAHYQPGQGIKNRFTALFQSSGTSETSVGWGIGNEEDGFFVGYDGTTFGFLHRSGGALEHQTLTISAGAGTASGNITITLDGVETTVALIQNDTIQDIVRKITATSFVGWDVQAFGTQCIFIDHIAQTRGADFTFDDTGTTGAAGTFSEIITGAAPTDNWTAQTDWSNDKFNGNGGSKVTLAPENGNVYQIAFGWLGFNDIQLRIKAPNMGGFVLANILSYPNQFTVPSIQNPTLPVYGFVKNGGTTTDITISSGSQSVFTEGVHIDDGISFSTSTTLALGTTTETCILVLKNKPIFQEVQNRVEYIPTMLTFSANGTGGTKATTLRLIHNPIVGGPTSYSDISTNQSVIAVDTSSTTRTGGNILGTFAFGTDQDNFVLGPEELFEIMGEHSPGNVMAITVELDAGTSDIEVGIVWKELL